MNNRVITYIDGFNLYFGMRAKGWQRYYWLDICKLSEALTSSTETVTQVKYFSARISRPNSKQARQNTYLEALGTLSNCSLHFGHYQSSPRECNRCKHIDYVPSEKMTDVNIAVEMMTDAFSDMFDTAYLISADSDLTPPVRKILQTFPHKKVVVVFPPERGSKQLRKVASNNLHVFRRTLAESQLPDEVLKPDGFVLKRPQKWTSRPVI